MEGKAFLTATVFCLTAFVLSAETYVGVSGSVLLPFEDKTVKANFRGIVLPGWTGCGCHDEDKDLPLLLGSTWFSDRVQYVDPSTKKVRTLSVRRGCSVSGETQISE